MEAHAERPWEREKGAEVEGGWGGPPLSVIEGVRRRFEPFR